MCHYRINHMVEVWDIQWKLLGSIYARSKYSCIGIRMMIVCLWVIICTINIITFLCFRLLSYILVDAPVASVVFGNLLELRICVRVAVVTNILHNTWVIVGIYIYILTSCAYVEKIMVCWWWWFQKIVSYTFVLFSWGW